MDSSIKNMFDAFKDDIWKELGPVDPNWFEVLTAQASLGEGHVDDNDDLCANQEGLFKAPLEKTAVESQLFSTPKVFRSSQMVSPEVEDEPSFTAAQGKETSPWVATQSPCLFEPTKQRVLDVKCEGVQPQGEESFDLLDTPKKSPYSYVKHISESLGAQINPDISWTSSFNTPPAMPSTLILSKTEESPCPASVTADRNVVLVRKLFPSLSNSSLKTPKKSVESSNFEGVVFPVAQHFPDSPLDQSGSHWQQKDPDTVKEVSGAVGLKNASSDFHFFANSSSALRKVKPDRVKGKQITLTNEDTCSHQAVSEADNGASSEEATTDLESGGLPATPLVKTGDSQWSPINLSEISSCAMSSSMTQPGDTDSVQHSRPSLKVTDTGFIRKRRQFVYSVTTKTLQIKCQDSESQKMDSSTKISEYVQKATLKTLKNTTGKVECQKIQQCLGEPATYSAVPKLQDVDMSQLCREFAKEFSQMTDLHIAEDAQSNFSPAACLTAMKQAKQKVNQANPPNDISANKQVPTVYQPCSVSEGTMIDSRVQSAVKDVTHMTTLSFGPPRSENFSQSRPSLSFKTHMHHLPSSNESGNPTINAEVSLHKSTKEKNLDTGKGIDLHTESTSAGHSRSREETVDESNRGQLEKASIVPFANASGFKTASNKGIHISPANLERGKRFFEEADGEKTSHDLSITTPYAKNNKRNLIPETTKPKPSNSNLLPKVEKPSVNINSHLTASEKADVTELCCLLEEADSQFEFTQFKPAKNLPNREYDFHTSPRQDKDLDPAFLQDIDFDDSFSSDCGKHPGVAVMNDNMALALSNGETAKGINLYTDLSMSNSLRENSCLSENISETGKCPKLRDIFPRAEDTKASDLKSNSTLMHGQGFKTAGGVMLQVSKKSLSRARALFAELENNLTEQKRADKQESKNVAQTEQKCDVDSDIRKYNSFILKESCDVGNKSEDCFSNLDEVRCSNKNPSSVEDKNVLESSETDEAKCEIGKGISISAKHMKGADVLFKDCQVIEHKEEKSTKDPPESVERGRSFSNFKSPKVNIYKEGFAGCSKFENENSTLIPHTGGLHRDEVEMNSMSTLALKNENGKKPFSTSKPSAILGTSKSIDLSTSKDLCTSDGFRTAAGKNISVSVAAMTKAASLLNQIDTPVETNKQPNQKKKTSETECLSNVMSKIDNGGFETVVEVRKFATLKKPTLSKEHEKSEDKISANQSKIPGNDSRSGGFFAASDEPGFLSSEALEKEKALFSDSSLNMDDVSETVAVRRIEKPETKLCSYTTAGGTKDQVSRKNLPKPKDQFEELDDLDLTKAVDEEGLFSVFDEGNVRGSKQAELYNCYPGDKKKINISMKSGCSRGAEKQVEVKENILPQASHGLQAASGRKADVSSDSLKRVESLCSEFKEIKNKTNATTPQFEATPPPLKNSGFHSVSGKPMAPSAEEVEKPKSRFGNITRRAKDPDFSQIRKTDDIQDDQNKSKKIFCGFTTARGEKVNVSQKNLQKAKIFFKEVSDLGLTKAMQDADILFRDDEDWTLDGNSDASLEQTNKVSTKESGSITGNLSQLKPDRKQTVDVCEEPVSGLNKANQKEGCSMPGQNGGFQTASGKTVVVSCEALSRATFLSEKNSTTLQFDATAPPLKNSGFHSVKGKPMAPSAEEVEKPKSLFNITRRAEVPDVSQTRKTDDKQDDQNKSKKIFCGFTTAKGEKVNVSQKNLQKAKIFFKEVSDLGLTKAMQDADILFRDDEDWTLDGNSDASLEQTNKVSTKESCSITGNLSQLKPDRKQTVDVCEEPVSGLNKANQKEGCSMPGQKCGFQTASGKTVVVSCEALSRATFLSEKNSTTLQFDATAPPLKNSGFHSVSGKPMAPSAEEVEKPKSLFNITRRAEVPDVSQTRKTDDKQDDQNKSKKIFCGFTTAKGEKVNVSQKNLQKAKIFFKEVIDLGLTKAMQDTDISFRDNEGSTLDGNSDTSSEQTNKVSTKESGSIMGNLSQLKPDKKQAAGICEEPESSSIKANQKEGCSMPGQNGGFQTASGNTVAVSCEALLRPKLLSENKVDDEGICAPSQLSETPVTGPGLMNGGFFSASGKPVAISSEALQKAKALCSDISVTTALPYPTAQSKKEKMKCGLTNVGVTNVINSELSHVKYTEGTLNPISPPRSGNRKNHSAVQSFPLAADIGSDHEEKPCMIVCDLDIKNSIKRSEVLTTGPEFQSLNLAGCTETQQMIFAQEAFDCTKALLDDEVRIGQSLLMGSEHFQIPEDCKSNGKSTEEAKRKKTRNAEDLTAQPPSKRRLLEEFSETTDGPRGSGLHPIKSSPNGLMDRGVFKYNTSLHPHITKPHRDAKSFVQSRYQRTTDTNPGDRTSASSKMQAFVPPFIKSAKRAVSNNPEVGDRKRVPVFVPPFKKQQIVLQMSLPEHQGSDTNNDAPLPKKTPSSTDIVPLMKSSNTNVMIPSVPENEEPVGAAETSHVDNMLSRSQDRTENIMLARDMQDMRIRKKKRQTIRPLPGSLFLTRTSGVLRIPLKVAVNGNKPTRCSAKELYECGVHKHVPEITGANAESFRFNLLQFVKQEMITDGGGVQLADGGWLIPSNDWTAGREEFYRALCDTLGVDPKLISEQWVYNHYRWIVWKQASMEKSFPEKMGSLCLTPEQILLQLKYRYDVEVDHSRRPALKKIMERDDTPAKTLILCVCEIVSRGHLLNAQSRSDTKTTQSAENNPSAIIWLTDGWYAIKAQLDEPLTAMLHKGRLAVGGKLMIHGAQLVGSQDACSPLEAPDSLMLKICANSTRRARWDAKLGFHKDPRPFLLPISCLFSNGGLVGCVDVLILRSYPMQWMERKSDGGVVFRSDRAEEKEARRFSRHKQKVMEMLFAKIQAEFEKEEEGRAKPQRRRQKISKQDVANLQEGVELYEAVGDDPAYLEAHLSKKQMETLQTYRSSLMEKKQAELQDRYRRALDAEDNEMSCPKRDVTPVWRLCIADSKDQSSCVYKLNLWRPSFDLQSLLKEGCRFKVYNLAVSDGKNRSTIETVQLTGTKKTQFQEMPASPEWLSSRFRPRVATDFADLQNEEFKPLCGEVDLVGYVISVIDQQGPSSAFYLVDGKQNFVKVRCFTSLAQAGLEDVVKPGVLLALSNLQLRGQSVYPTPVVYAGDLTAFSTNPKEIHLQESLQQLKKLVQCQDNFCPSAEEKLAQLVKSDGMQSVCSPSLQPQPAGSATDRRQSLSSNVTFQKPGKSLGSFTPVGSKLPAPTSSTEKDPKSLKRKRALDYLSRIPSPPPISPLGSVVSPCVKRTFNPPRRSGPPSTLKPALTVEPQRADSLVEDEWVNDEELAMIDTQELHVGNLL